MSSSIKRVASGYSVGDIKGIFPSVTTVLNVIDKPGLLNWSVKMALSSMTKSVAANVEGDTAWVDEASSRAAGAGREIASRAASFGTRAHDAINNTIKGLDTSVPGDVQCIVDNFESWRSASKGT